MACGTPVGDPGKGLLSPETLQEQMGPLDFHLWGGSCPNP